MRPLSVTSETRLRPSFLRTTPAKNPRTECCCHPVAVMIAAIVAPVDDRSIATMRACLVSGRDAVFAGAGAVRVRDSDLPAFRGDERVAALVFELGLVMGSSEVTRHHPPHHLSPAQASHPAGQDPEGRLSRPKSPQQCSDQARMPVVFEQDSCSFGVRCPADERTCSNSNRSRPAIRRANAS